MPCALDTNDTYKLVLHNDSGKPEQERPALVFRYLSARETKKAAKLLDEFWSAKMDEKATLADYIDRGFAAVKVGLVGWENFGRPFDLNDVDDVLTVTDLVEVCERWLLAQQLSEIEKKRLGSLSNSNTAKPAEPASEAPVATPQPTTSR